LPDAGSGAPYGNLMSYKHHVRPAAYRMYGGPSGGKTGHQENVQGVLRILSLNGACTTWDVAKIGPRPDHQHARPLARQGSPGRAGQNPGRQ